MSDQPFRPSPPSGRYVAPLDQPQYGATIGQAVSRFFRKYVVFSGRASRSEYWWWVLVSTIVSIVLQTAGSLVIGGRLYLVGGARLQLREFLLPLLPALVWALVVLVPSVALVVRRLHDTNRSGWWYLLAVPALVGVPFQLVGLASIDPERMAVGDFGGVAIGPLVTGFVLSLVGAAGSIVLLVFFVLGPDPRGTRFDRRA